MCGQSTLLGSSRSFLSFLSSLLLKHGKVDGTYDCEDEYCAGLFHVVTNVHVGEELVSALRSVLLSLGLTEHFFRGCGAYVWVGLMGSVCRFVALSRSGVSSFVVLAASGVGQVCRCVLGLLDSMCFVLESEGCG